MKKRKSIAQIRNDAKLRKDVITFEGGRPEEDADTNDGRNSPNPDSLGVSNTSPVNEDNLDANDNMDSPGTSLYFNDLQSDGVKEDNEDDDEGDNHYDSNEERPLSHGRPHPSFLDDRCNEAVENAVKHYIKMAKEDNDNEDENSDGGHEGPADIHDDESYENIEMTKEDNDNDNSSDDGQGGDSYDDSMENVEMAILTDTSSIDVDKALVIRLIAMLIPLKVFLSTRLGGGYSVIKQGNCALRLCNLLVWTALNSSQKKILDESTLLPWMEEVLRTEYTAIDSHCQYLEDTKLYAASTIRNYLYDYG
jgi:hypothetical protein